jgi:hypothetical protein
MGERVGIDRQERESKLHHRALILYAMQDPGRRSVRAVAPGIGRAESVVRGWVTKERWAERVEAEGVTVQARACQLYRELYHAEWRLRDVAGPVEARMSVPVLAMAPPPTPGKPGEATSQVVSEDRETRESRTGKQVRPSELSDRARLEQQLRGHRGILERLLKDFADRLVGKPGVGPKPIAKISDALQAMKVHREISELVGDLSPGTANPTATETSFRVREAERLGKNTTEALLDDVLELATILRTMLDAEEHDPAWLEPAHPAQRPKRAGEAVEIPTEG